MSGFKSLLCFTSLILFVSQTGLASNSMSNYQPDVCNAKWKAPKYLCQGFGTINLNPLYNLSGNWFGPGITDNGDGTAIFDPIGLEGRGL